MQKAIVLQSFFNLKNQNVICNYSLRRLITCFMQDCGVLCTDDLFINIAFDCINLTLTFFLTLFCNFVREETILRHQTIRCTTTQCNDGTLQDIMKRALGMFWKENTNSQGINLANHEIEHELVLLKTSLRLKRSMAKLLFMILLFVAWKRYILYIFCISCIYICPSSTMYFCSRRATYEA